MSSATASWAAATDNVGVTGYEHRLNSGSWQSVGNALTVNLASLSPATSYTFQVRARDAANNLGSASSGTFTTSDTAAPSTPTGLTASAPASTTVNLSWSAATDNVAVTGYKIFRNSGQIGTSTTTSYTDSTVSGTTTYPYRVSAYDAASNNSAQSSVVSVTTPDTVAPSTPTGLSASAVSATQVNLSWNASTDTGGSGLAGYRIYRGGVQIATSASTSYSDITVSASTSYSYAVAAYDNATTTNVSGQSTSANVTTPAATPTTPGLSIQPGINSSKFTVLWTTPSGPVSYYELEGNANWAGPVIQTYYPPTTSKAFTGGDVDWQFRIRACNASNQCSVWSAPQDYHTCPTSGCP